VNVLEATVDMRDLDDGRVTASVPNDDALLDIALTPALPKLSSSSNILEQLETGGRASRRRRPAGPAGQTARGSVIPAASRAGTARSSRLCTALR
jgi:hypothetical protein